MEEGTKRGWDVALGIFAPLLAVVGLFVTVLQFNAGERNKTRLESDLVRQRDCVDFNRKLWMERLSAYRSVAEVTGKIAAHADDGKFGTLVTDFLAAYWGTMILVEDPPVERAMKDFYLTVTDYQRGYADSMRLKLAADALVKACRESAERDRVPLHSPGGATTPAGAATCT
jgi:hypothetical protein